MQRSLVHVCRICTGSMCAPRVCECEPESARCAFFWAGPKARGPSRGMAPEGATALVASWLAEQRGEARLREAWVKPLAALFDEGDLNGTLVTSSRR